jgi:nucleoside-diphosphate-sugar epimerase
MKKLVITGSSGFIGGYLSRGLFNDGYGIHAYKREDNSLGFSNPDAIIHCAANPNIRPEDPTTLWDSNIKLTHKLLELCTKTPNKPLFINLSSVAVYGAYKTPPSVDDKLSPLSEYGITKVASEMLVNKYEKNGVINGCNLRLGGVCGPHMTHGILKKIINHYQDSKPTIEFINPAPGNNMSYIHVHYIYELVKFLLDWSPTVQTYNVCSNDTMNIEQIIAFFNKKLNKNMKVKWIDKPGFLNDESIFVSQVNTPIDMSNISESLERTIHECLL